MTTKRINLIKDIVSNIHEQLEIIDTMGLNETMDSYNSSQENDLIINQLTRIDHLTETDQNLMTTEHILQTQ